MDWLAASCIRGVTASRSAKLPRLKGKEDWKCGEVITPRSDWCCGTPHIQAEDRLMNDQYTEPNVWADDLCTFEAATPTVEPIAVADSRPADHDQGGVNPFKCGCG